MTRLLALIAATLLAFPLLLMLGCVMLLLFGPFIVGGLGF